MMPSPRPLSTQQSLAWIRHCLGCRERDGRCGVDGPGGGHEMYLSISLLTKLGVREAEDAGDLGEERD
jgi:hypothetical protein